MCSIFLCSLRSRGRREKKWQEMHKGSAWCRCWTAVWVRSNTDETGLSFQLGQLP